MEKETANIIVIEAYENKSNSYSLLIVFYKDKRKTSNRVGYIKETSFSTAYDAFMFGYNEVFPDKDSTKGWIEAKRKGNKYFREYTYVEKRD